MAGPGSYLLSVLMLAAIALGAGGMVLLVRHKDWKKGLLMLTAAAVMLANVLIWVAPVPKG